MKGEPRVDFMFCVNYLKKPCTPGEEVRTLAIQY